VIHVNLLPHEERPASPRLSVNVSGRGVWIGLAAGLAILIPIIGIGVMQQVKIAGLKSDINQAETEVRQLRPHIDKINTLMRERGEINECLVTVQALARDRYLPVQLMDELADQTPEYLWLTKIRHGSVGQTALEGQTFSNLLVAELMTRMEEGTFFEDVSLSVSERKMVAGQPVVHFTVDARIKR
jgi:Tfp pilus assembly protein PilN